MYSARRKRLDRLNAQAQKMVVVELKGRAASAAQSSANGHKTVDFVSER